MLWTRASATRGRPTLDLLSTITVTGTAVAAGSVWMASSLRSAPASSKWACIGGGGAGGGSTGAAVGEDGSGCVATVGRGGTREQAPAQREVCEHTESHSILQQ